MKITKKNDHYLYENENGSYHLSFDEYERLGRKKAKELAKREIEKKLKVIYQDATIDFKRARGLGFCEYGIKDFCKRLNLDIDEEYSINELGEKLTPEAFLAYPNECFKLFGNNVLDMFGGAKVFLENNKTRKALKFIISKGYMSEKDLHELACEFAERVLPIFEKEFPSDDRPRKAIEAKRKWLKGELREKELREAYWAARSAVRSAARSAESSAWSAEPEAESAARSAAWAAESATRSAEPEAESATYWAAEWAAESREWLEESEAELAEIEEQIKLVLKRL